MHIYIHTYRAAALLCSSQKTLAFGIPFIKVGHSPHIVHPIVSWCMCDMTITMCVFSPSNESTDCLQLSTGYRVYSCSAADVCAVAAAAGLGLSGAHSGGIEIHQTLKFLSILLVYT